MSATFNMRILVVLFFLLFKKLNATVLPTGDQGLGSRNDTKFRVLTFSLIWLEELEDTYKSGFPKNFGVTKYRNISTVPNHNVPSGDGSTCQNVTFFSVEQNRRLINKYGWDSVFNSTTQEMIEYPRARLYSFNGETEDYRCLRSERPGMCSNLKKLRRRVESVFTFGKCIRLFQYQNCFGWSLAVYPGIRHSEELMGPRDVTFQAIGPCLTNEFADGGFNESFPSLIFKNPEFRSFIPDFACMTPVHAITRLKRFDQLLYTYSLGPKNRIQNIIAAPIPGQILQSLRPFVSKKDSLFLKSTEEENGDVIGYAIPPKFGGTTKEAFNRFPASASCLIRWDNVLSGFVGNPFWFVYLKFEYENEIETRPLYFYYSITITLNLRDDDIKSNRYYGRIINEHPTKLKRHQPYVQPNERHKVTARNLHYIHKNFSPVFQKSLESSTFSNFLGSNYSNVRRGSQRPNIQCQQFISNNEDSIEHQGLGNSTNWSNLVHVRLIRGNPMVRLFIGENFTGTFEDYHSGMTKYYSGCYNTREVRKVKSAATLNKCARLFTNTECRGLSLAIYPGHGNSNVSIDTILGQVLSVGPCITADFTEDKRSSSAFPDIFVISETRRPNNAYLTNAIQVFYDLGNKSRVEHIQAQVLQTGLLDITERLNMEKSIFYKSQDKKQGDVPNFVIPVEIGGPQNESFNVFPIRKSRVDKWARIFPTALSDQNEVFDWDMTFKFVYDSENNTRPKFIYYYFKRTVGHIYYGRFENY